MSCSGFDPNTSLFAGLDTATLQAALSSAQAALIALDSGKQTVNVQVTGGGQHREVTFAKIDRGGLVNLIRQLQAQLGIIAAPRTRARIRFH
jgi:hypothetical protein